MSTADTKASMEETFATKHGLEMSSPRVFAKMIDASAGTRIVVCAIGPSGIGKTAIPMQIAKRRGVPYAALHMPTATQEGFFIPTVAADTKRFFDQRVPRLFQPIIEHAEKMVAEYGDDVPADKCCILSIEELNRAVDKSVTRAAFVLIGDRMIGDVKLPNCVQIVVTMNPSGGGMSVNEFEKDPAMRRRLLQVAVPFSYGDFMKYAQDSGFHPSVVAHLGAQPSHAYDDAAANAGKAFACPATWESVSQVCYRFDALGIPLTDMTAQRMVAGAIGSAAATHFLDFVKDHTLTVTPEDILTTYGPTAEARQRFRAYLTKDGGRLDKVADLSMGVAVRIFADLSRKPNTFSKQLAHFFDDLPEEIMMSFIEKMAAEAARLGADHKNYFQALNAALVEEDPYTAALTRLSNAEDAGKMEAQASATA